MKTLWLGFHCWIMLSDLISQPHTKSATITVYRQREFGGRDFTIYVNDRRIGSLATNRYIRVEVPPGQLRIESKRDYFTEEKILSFRVASGETYYVKAVEEIDFLSHSLFMARVSEEQAKGELRRIKPVKLTSDQHPD